jgi:hypothetical protein
LVLPTEEVSDRKKLKIIVILCGLPTGTWHPMFFVYADLALDEEPRSLENSVDFAVKSLGDADLPGDRIGIQFVQVGFSRGLFDALKDVVAKDLTVSSVSN